MREYTIPNGYKIPAYCRWMDAPYLDFQSANANRTSEIAGRDTDLATLPDSAYFGRAPRTITATRDADHYLIANISDYDKGLGTLVLTRARTAKSPPPN